MKYVFLAMLLTLLSGCGTSPIVSITKMGAEEINFPNSGQLVTKNIGEVIVKKGSLELREALNITDQTQFNKKDGDSSVWTCALTVEPQIIYLRGTYQTREIQADCYGSVNTRRTLADGSTNFNCPGAPLITGDICRESSGNIFLAFLSQRAELKQDFDNLQFVEKVSGNEDNFLQEIVYNGRSGDRIKFVYKEYSGGGNKPDYFQEFESDISTNSRVIFKNMKLQVLEATGSAITFKLEENF
ncbi:MAG: hypothetical protein KBT63_07335 [Porticoccaceae bacterium]|nr:hypothetical protein [Porticoccaceae bacterium]